jgi:hypothetical protein
MEPITKKHVNPVWQEKANFIIRAKCFNSKNQLVAQEQIWSKQILENSFEICCIPFFVRDISLGDIVETDEEHWVTKVTKQSGHYTFRVWFGDSKSATIRDDVIKLLAKEKYLFEWHSHNLLAIDIPNETLAAEFSGLLVKKQTLKELVFETGKS